jgi:hypothetical protein
LIEKIGTISKYQLSSPEEVQSEQREEQEIWKTLNGFRGSGRGSPQNDEEVSKRK